MRYIRLIGVSAFILAMGFLSVGPTSNSISETVAVIIYFSLFGAGVGAWIPKRWYVSGFGVWAVFWSFVANLVDPDPYTSISRQTFAQAVLYLSGTIILALLSGYLGAQFRQYTDQREKQTPSKLPEDTFIERKVFTSPLVQIIYRPFQGLNPHLLVIVGLALTYLLFVFPVAEVVYEPVRNLPETGIQATAFLLPMDTLEDLSPTINSCINVNAQAPSRQHQIIYGIISFAANALIMGYFFVLLGRYMHKNLSKKTWTIALIIYFGTPVLILFIVSLIPDTPISIEHVRQYCEPNPVIQINQVHPYYPTFLIYGLSYLFALMVRMRTYEALNER